MQSVQEIAPENQAVPQEENSSRRKVGIEIRRSVDLPSRFFYGWRAASYSLRNAPRSRRPKRAIR